MGGMMCLYIPVGISVTHKRKVFGAKSTSSAGLAGRTPFCYPAVMCKEIIQPQII